MKKFQLVSDLHLTCDEDFGTKMICGWDTQDCDTLVIAGDIGEFWFLRDHKNIIDTICEMYKEVVYVLGNHEPYGSSIQETIQRAIELDNLIPNFHFVNNFVTMVNGISIAGTTLWFKKPQDRFQKYERYMNDFSQITNFKREVYEENAKAIEFLKELRGQNLDLVITHHLVSVKSVHNKYLADPLNIYFLCDVEWIIKEINPKICCHGHTHLPCDYTIGDTRVYCHPRGYPNEWSGYQSYQPLTIEF